MTTAKAHFYRHQYWKHSVLWLWVRSVFRRPLATSTSMGAGKRYKRCESRSFSTYCNTTAGAASAAEDRMLDT
ncbi:hypothetical protein PG994_015308 [Apiospora phragmitis]|uniref:Secreted protein n=1 Tax=Apiospora phragmitis TaxID=2905665 RepID=A0ABR1SR56_9PEZI